jgi:hypothetical protein
VYLRLRLGLHLIPRAGVDLCAAMNLRVDLSVGLNLNPDLHLHLSVNMTCTRACL